MRPSQARKFSEAEDALLVNMREANACWQEIGRAIGCSGSTIRARTTIIRPDLTVSNRDRAAAAAAEAEEAAEPATETITRTEAPLPPMHPLSWFPILVSSQRPLTD